MARPRKTYRPSYGGDPIPGLTRRPDGRWRCQDCGRLWTQADERQAVAQYREHRRQEHDAPQIVASYDIPIATGEGWAIGRTATADVWAYVRSELISRPDWVAEQVGIPEVARLASLPTPAPSPPLADLLPLYLAGKSDIRKAERQRVANYYTQFVRFAAARDATTAKDVTHDLCGDWDDQLRREGKHKSDSWRRHRINAVRTVVNYALSRGKDVERATTALRSIRSPGITVGEPKPISRTDWRAILDNADPTMRALLLLSLNGGFYAVEALRLTWDEVDLANAVVTTRRNKRKKVIRVATLWSETVEALSALTRTRQYIFPADRGGMMHYQTLNKRFARLCSAAGVDGVTYSHIRDGAVTACYRQGISPDTVRLLIGHRQGMTDHYVLRNPQMVAPACDAIYNFYFR